MDRLSVPAGSIIEVTDMNGDTYIGVVGEEDFHAMCNRQYPGYTADGNSVWVMILTGEWAGSPQAVREDEGDRWQRIHGHIHIDRAQRYALA